MKVREKQIWEVPRGAGMVGRGKDRDEGVVGSWEVPRKGQGGA